jgi:hypothetical protein
MDDKPSGIRPSVRTAVELWQQQRRASWQNITFLAEHFALQGLRTVVATLSEELPHDLLREAALNNEAWVRCHMAQPPERQLGFGDGALGQEGSAAAAAVAAGARDRCLPLAPLLAHRQAGCPEPTIKDPVRDYQEVSKCPILHAKCPILQVFRMTNGVPVVSVMPHTNFDVNNRILVPCLAGINRILGSY